MKRLSLQKQLLLYMVLLIAVPLLFMTAFGNYFYAQAIDEQANDYSTQMLEQVRLNLDSSVGAVDRVIEYLTKDANVLSYLRLKDFYDPDRIELETLTRLSTRAFVDANADLIGGILIAGENDLYASNELYRISRHSLTEESWYRDAADAAGARVLIPRPIGRNIRHYRNYSAEDIVSVVRAVTDPETGEVLGVICADMLTDVIEERIRDLTLGKSGYVFVLDDEGGIVYAPVNRTVYRIRPEWLENGPALHKIGDETVQLLYAHSDATGWGAIGVFRSGEVLEPVLTLRRYTLFVALVAILLATATALSFSSSFTDPISRLRRLMGEAEHGNLNVEFDTVRSSGEVRQLGDSFNNMMDRIRDLLHLVYVEQRDKREAEIRTLQAQIKPHFLYNTLDTIRWMAEEYQAREIVQLVGALTRLFRIGLSRGREVIPLSEELEHVRCYLYIQKVRYEEKLDYEIDAAEDTLDLPVNKLILQPLVENAIYHGIKQKRGAGRIRIEARRVGDRLVMKVIDDGAGMSEAKLKLINEALSAPTGADISRGYGYGVFNVNDRIRLSHGENYGLNYSVNDMGGITVTITCPALAELPPDDE